jgi:hypothetical protein
MGALPFTPSAELAQLLRCFVCVMAPRESHPVNGLTGLHSGWQCVKLALDGQTFVIFDGYELAAGGAFRP